MFKSPDNQYIYILHHTYSYEYQGMNSICKTQIRCFCKDNFDVADTGRDFVVYEFSHQQPPDKTYYQGYNDEAGEHPLVCAMSHTDGKSVWIITSTANEDSIVALKLTGGEIKEKVSSYFRWKCEDLYISVYPLTVSDNGKIYISGTNNLKDKTLVLYA